MTRRLALTLVGACLVGSGIGWLLQWPVWNTAASPLATLLGTQFAVLMGVAEAAVAIGVVAVGLVTIYLAAIDGHSRITRRMEHLAIVSLLMLLASAASLALFGGELMAHNHMLSRVARMLWQWQWHHRRGTIVAIEEGWRCCGWSQNKLVAAPFCVMSHEHASPACGPLLLHIAGRNAWRVAEVSIAGLLTLLLAVSFLAMAPREDETATDIETAVNLDTRRKQLYTGTSPALQLD